MKMRVTILFIAVCLFINVNAQSWWSKKTNYGGTARYAATGFSIGTMGYIGTGIDQSGVKQDFWEWNQITNTWTQKSNLPGSSRSDAVGWSIGNKGYIVGGGANVGGPFYPELWEYDPSLNIWVQKANFPGTTLFRATGFVIGNKGYIGTGWNGSFKNEFWEWNQITNTWTQKTSFGGSARWDAIGFSIGNKGYIGCGYATSLAVNDFWEWDQATDAWTQKANVGGLPRSGGVAFSIGGYGYVGTGGQDPGPVFTKDFWRWDPSTNTWTAEMPFSGLERGDAVSFAIGNRGYLGVGYNTGGIYYNDFWEFFPAANSLISLTTNKTNVLCNGGHDGLAVVNVSGGSAPYMYLWSNGATTSSISNLSAGAYTVTVTDNTGSTAIISTTITEPSSLVINTTINNTSCNFSNGSISATINGGVSPYTYNWSNGVSTPNISGLSAGTYSLMVTDANGCNIVSVNSVISVNNQGIWTKKANFSGVARWGASGFSIGNKGYIGTGYNGSDMKDFWEWNQATNIWTQKASMPSSNRRAGIGFSIGNKGYIGTGVSSSSSFYNDLWEYDPTLNTWVQKASIPTSGFYGGAGFAIGNKGYVTGGNEGSASGPYTNKLWEYDPSLNTWVQKANFPGTPRYGVRGYGTSQKGYFGLGVNQANQTIFYKDFWEYNPANDSWSKLTDYPGGGSGYASGFALNGKIYVGTGQTAAIAYKDFWEYDPIAANWTQKANYGGGNRWLITGFSIGNKGYFGTGYDFTNYYNDFWEYSNSCSDVDVHITSSNVLCNADNNGHATAVTANGVAPYTYLWSNGATVDSISNLSAGIYSVVVTDNVGATASASVTITEPASLVVNTVINNPTCNSSNGSISANVNGGVPGYTYNWSNGATTQIISGISAGVYSLIVKDANNCSVSSIDTIGSLDNIKPTAICKNVIVYLDSSGSASITAADVDGGSFDNCGIVNMQVSQNKFDCDGSKNILFSVEDASGNMSTCTTLVLVKDSISPVLICPSDIHVSACNPQVFWNNVIVKDNCSTTLTSTHNSGDYFPLGKTNVTYTAVDSFGNSSSCSFNVFVHTDSLLTSISSSNVSCNGASDGTVSVNVTGGCSPYSYLWSNGITSSSVSSLSAGIYSVTITDNAGLVVSATTTITQPAILVVDAVVNNGNCNANNGTISLNVNGGVSPYNYKWSNGASISTISGLSAGTYTVIVTDANGCTASVIKTITTSSAIIVDAGANQTVYDGYSPNSCVHLNGTGSGGVLPYSYEWSTGATTKSIKVCPTSNKQYTLTITDAQGCFATDVVKVCVLNIRCNKVCSNSDKVEICHVMGNGKTQTLCVAAPAVPAHLAHGDQLGACGVQTSCEEGYTKETLYSDIILEEMGITAYPNPFLTETMVRFNVMEQEQVEVGVYNILGIKVATLFDGIIEGMELYETKFVADESLPNGIYFLKIITSKGDMKVVRVLLSK